MMVISGMFLVFIVLTLPFFKIKFLDFFSLFSYSVIADATMPNIKKEFSYMKVDLTITVTAILGIAAIISPIATAIINNHYQLKIKKIELGQKQLENTTYYIRSIFENYLKYAGKCISYPDAQSQKDYGECYFLALSYAPDDLVPIMVDINSAITGLDPEKATRLLEQLRPQINELLRTM